MRVSRELAGMRQRELRALWCDGFLPDALEVVGQRCRMTGQVWMASGGGEQTLWTFVLHLGPARSREEIDWTTMLPRDNVTGWLSLDFETRFMKVNPIDAHPDGDPARPIARPYTER